MPVRVEVPPTDSQGAKTTVVRTIKPRLVQLTLTSSPADVPVSYDGDTGPAPQVHTSAVGFQVTVEAPTTTVPGPSTRRP